MMKRCLPLLLAGLTVPAYAQTPAVRMMPDGSRDMYVGLGVQSRPFYEGAGVSRTSAVLALQVQWSNGIFISGSSAGWHLGQEPGLEYGPLVAIDAGRTRSGAGKSLLGDVGGNGVNGGGLLPSMIDPGLTPPTDVPAPRVAGTGRARLDGMPDIDARLTGGGFINYYLADSTRLMGTVLYGTGESHRGALAQVNLQHVLHTLAPHHTVQLTAGLTWANGDYNRTYFGVTGANFQTSGNRVYRPGGGLKDSHVGVRWSWALSNDWILATTVTAARLHGEAAASPLTERRTQLTATTALAYRF
ncbi:MAG TPA: MipA/OmpV family protein [Burkholderiaceae bacterium]